MSGSNSSLTDQEIIDAQYMRIQELSKMFTGLRSHYREILDIAVTHRAMCMIKPELLEQEDCKKFCESVLNHIDKART